MVDITDPVTRSRVMSRIRAQDTGPEKRVRSFLHAAGFRFRKNKRDLPGTPDIVLRRFRTVVQVHGCFWHQHPGCPKAARPDSPGWRAKLDRNVQRDRESEQALAEKGWRVLIMWECESDDPERLAALAYAIRHPD